MEGYSALAEVIPSDYTPLSTWVLVLSMLLTAAAVVGHCAVTWAWIREARRVDL